MNIRLLTPGDFDALVACFNESFSDYVVPFHVTADSLRLVIARRGVRFDASVGAFDDAGRMTGFTLNGIDGARAYDSGTGVVPSARRGGWGRRLMEASFARIRELGAHTYVLEVIESNEKAANLYRSLGFVETRALQCWSLQPAGKARFTEVANADLGVIRSWCDVAPSWQNDVPSIQRAAEPYFVLGNEAASIVVFPSNGDVAMLAVAHDARWQRLGTQLLHAAATRCAKPLRIINVDARDGGIAAFLTAAGATPTVRQLEMVREG